MGWRESRRILKIYILRKTLKSKMRTITAGSGQRIPIIIHLLFPDLDFACLIFREMN